MLVRPPAKMRVLTLPRSQSKLYAKWSRAHWRARHQKHSVMADLEVLPPRTLLQLGKRASTQLPACSACKLPAHAVPKLHPVHVHALSSTRPHEQGNSAVPQSCASIEGGRQGVMPAALQNAPSAPKQNRQPNLPRSRPGRPQSACTFSHSRRGFVSPCVPGNLPAPSPAGCPGLPAINRSVNMV